MPALAVLGPDPRAVHLGEAARDREPEPGAADAVRAALERLENELPRSGLDAGPVVEDVKAYLIRA